MPNLIEVESGDGSVLVAVKAPPGSVRATTSLGDTIEKIGANIDDAFKTVDRVVQAFRRNAQAFGDTFSGAEIEMGLSFSAKGSVYVVEAEGEAAFKIKLKFGRNSEA